MIDPPERLSDVEQVAWHVDSAALLAAQARRHAARARTWALLAGALFLFQLVFVAIVLYTAP